MEIGKAASEVGEGNSGVAGKIHTGNCLGWGLCELLRTGGGGAGLEAEISIRNGGLSTPLSVLFCLLLFPLPNLTTPPIHMEYKA